MPKLYGIQVPNELPRAGFKILFVGEAPGETEEIERRPFSGASGNLFINCLMRNGMSREEVGIANLCQYRPVYNKFENALNSSELASGLKDLYTSIGNYKPAVIVPFGNWPLYYLTGKGNGKSGISAWRGSILPYQFDKTIKVIPTFHPAFVVRSRTAYPIFDQDIKKAAYDSTFPEFNYPEYTHVIAPEDLAVEEWTQRLMEAPILACDIESVMNSTHILCISFSPSRDLSVVFPWTEYNQTFIQRILNGPSEKIFHYGMFDSEMLWVNGMTINNYVHDTIVMANVLNPELPRGLDYLCSIYTRQPYYKSSGRKEIPKDKKQWSAKSSKKQLYEYNGTDTCVTFACFEEMSKELNEQGSRDYYRYRMSLVPAINSIGRTGLPIDHERKALIKHALMNKYVKLYWALNALVGHEVNVRSPKLADVLYGELKLPPRRNRNGGVTTDEDAIVSLIGFVKGRIAELKTDRVKADWNRKLSILTAILKSRGVRQLLSNYINAKESSDGRIRSVYKPAATETARLAGERYVDGTGFNPQTLPRAEIEITDADLETFNYDENKFEIAPYEDEEEEELEEDAA